ncbi:MAG: hypothetical protein CMJ19_21785 [Phycisphaeraceae bacterium]|nr:hypothetical protein [Phycisphaeraceae bacterium]
MMKSLLSLFFCTLLFSDLNAQTIRSRDFRQDSNGDIVLELAIEAKNSHRERYEMTISRSFDNSPFIQLDKTYKDIEPGAMTIRLTPQELKGEGSSLQLKVDIKATTFPLVVRSKGKVKRGKKFDASWSGYNDRGPYKIELIGGNLGSYTLASAQDSQIFGQEVSKDIAKGSYKLRVTPQNRDAYGEMDFKVVGGNTLLILAPIVAGGGAAAYLLTAGGEGGDDPSGLPDPPTTPE